MWQFALPFIDMRDDTYRVTPKKQAQPSLTVRIEGA
jgi:hypothetical protein